MQPMGPRRPWSSVDQLVLELVRLVQDEHWSDVDAAAELRRQGHDENALVLARARVAAAQVERPSAYGDRAIATLNAALGPSVLHDQPPS